MALAPKPITLTQADTFTGPGGAPQPMQVIGTLPSSAIAPAAFVSVNLAPATAADVAADLKSVVDSLIAAGLMAAS
jgi:hypothetical protein